ncbi:NYN domain-containing protein, partial [Thermus brockianus]
MERVIAYVDGFNLYFGLREAKLKRYYWLDVSLLAKNLLKPQQHLVATHYFTARIQDTAPFSDIHLRTHLTPPPATPG